MAQYEIEIILLRQLASLLAMPVFVVDVDGNLLYYNEPAELILGRRYDENGEMPLSEWSTIFTPTDRDGRPLDPDGLPLVIAVRDRTPASAGMYITGLDGERRAITVVAIPLVGQGGRQLGSAAMFWEDDG